MFVEDLKEELEKLKEELDRFQYGFNFFYNWYEDKNYKIGFSDIPNVDTILVLNVNIFKKEELKDMMSKPYILDNCIEVYLEDKKKNVVYTFYIPAGYRYDGATIPRFFWRLIGPKGDARFLIAALVHDVLCENHNYVDGDRYFANKIFERLLYVAGVNPFHRWMMFHSVDNFQKFCGWGKK